MKNLLQLSAQKKESLKYIADLDHEIGALFGRPLPRLPQGDEDEEGRKRIFVDLAPNVGILLRDFLQAVYPIALGQAEAGKTAEESFEGLKETLINIATQTVLQERRHGLYNLFYLALSKVMAEIVRSFFSSGGRKPYHKYLLHSELSTLFSGVHAGAMRRVEGIVPGSSSFRLGPAFNGSLVHTILEDQLPLVTTELEEVLIQDVLGVSNCRFLMSYNVYKEIFGILSSRIRKGIDQREKQWLMKIQSIADVPHSISHQDIGKILRHTDVVRHMLMDYEEVGRKILSSKTIQKEAPLYSELGSTYLELMEVLKRNEVIQLLKRNIEILSNRQAGRAEDLYSTGSLYRFHEKGRVVNEARNVTTVFLDLRGFTRKSEEAISAGELTDELYAIFDPMTTIIQELHGKIDKFTGDGMMITFGVDSRGKEDALNALRMAIRVHESLRSLRMRGTTQFQMGISIHSGVAFVSNFIAGEERVDRTVIGRNVNIAGRLSSAGDMDRFRKERKEFDELVGSLSRSLTEEGEKDRFLESLQSRKTMEKSVSGVSVDAKGNLYNSGIVLSQQTIQAVNQAVELQSGEDGEVGYLFFFDPVLSRRISLYYVGDAKFKGVESSCPVYAVLL